MRTFKRICIETHTVRAENGDEHTVKRGEEVITTDAKNGEVIVFGPFWTPMPLHIFAGEERFTS